MKIIVGLGNPGPDYTLTRHNVGFLAVDTLAEVLLQDAGYIVNLWQVKPDWSAEVAVARRSGEEQILLVKPQTFMNKSGFAVQQIIHFYRDKVDITTDLTVIFDDLDLKIGTYKVDRLKFPRTHNGVASINEHIHQLDYYKVRIGVDNRDQTHRIEGEQYVLQRFTPEELQTLTTSVMMPMIKQLRATLVL